VKFPKGAQNEQIKKTDTVGNKRKNSDVSRSEWLHCTVPGDGKGIDGKPCTMKDTCRVESEG